MAHTAAVTIGDERICTKCGDQQPLENFRQFRHRSNGKMYREGQCDSCRVLYAKNYEWRGMKQLNEQKRLLVDERKKLPCVDCGQRFPSVCMDFDHVRGEKKAGISMMVAQTWSMDLLLEELAKCDLVCANCHRIRTHKDDGIHHRRRILEGRRRAGLPTRKEA